MIKISSKNPIIKSPKIKRVAVHIGEPPIDGARVAYLLYLSKGRFVLCTMLVLSYITTLVVSLVPSELVIQNLPVKGSVAVKPAQGLRSGLYE